MSLPPDKRLFDLYYYLAYYGENDEIARIIVNEFNRNEYIEKDESIIQRDDLSFSTKEENRLSVKQLKRYSYEFRNDHFSSCVASNLFALIRNNIATLEGRYWIITYLLLDLIKGNIPTAIKQESSEIQNKKLSLKSSNILHIFETDTVIRDLEKDVINIKFGLFKKLRSITELLDGSFSSFVVDYYDNSSPLDKLLKTDYTETYQIKRSIFYLLYLKSRDVVNFFDINEYNENLSINNPIIMKFVVRLYTACQLLGFYKSEELDKYYMSFSNGRVVGDDDCVIDFDINYYGGHRGDDLLLIFKRLFMNGAIEVICKYYLLISHILIILIGNINTEIRNSPLDYQCRYFINFLEYYNGLIKKILKIGCEIPNSNKAKITQQNVFLLTYRHPVSFSNIPPNVLQAGSIRDNFKYIKNKLESVISNRFIRSLTFRFVIKLTRAFFEESGIPIEFGPQFLVLVSSPNKLKREVQYLRYINVTNDYEINTDGINEKRMNNYEEDRISAILEKTKDDILPDFFVTDVAKEDCLHLYSYYANLLSLHISKNKKFYGVLSNITLLVLEEMNEYVFYDLYLVESIIMSFSQQGLNTIPLKLIYDQLLWLSKTIHSEMIRCRDVPSNKSGEIVECGNKAFSYFMSTDEQIRNLINIQYNYEKKTSGKVPSIHSLENENVYQYSEMDDSIGVIDDFDWLTYDKEKLTPDELKINELFATQVLKKAKDVTYYVDTLRTFDKFFNIILLDLDKTKSMNELTDNQVLIKFITENIFKISNSKIKKENTNEPQKLITTVEIKTETEIKKEPTDKEEEEDLDMPELTESESEEEDEKSEMDKMADDLNSVLDDLEKEEIERERKKEIERKRKEEIENEIQKTSSITEDPKVKNQNTITLSKPAKENTNIDGTIILSNTEDGSSDRRNYKFKASKLIVAYSKSSNIFVLYSIDIYHIDINTYPPDKIDPNKTIGTLIKVTAFPCTMVSIALPKIILRIFGVAKVTNDEVVLASAIDAIIKNESQRKHKDVLLPVKISSEPKFYVVNNLDDYTNVGESNVRVFNRFTYVHWIIQCFNAGIPFYLLESNSFLKLFGKNIGKYIFGQYQTTLKQSYTRIN